MDHIRHLRLNFQAQGHEVWVLTPSSRPAESAQDPLVVPLGRVTAVPINDSVARITLSLRLHKTVHQLLRREAFDVVHLHEPLFPLLSLTVLGCSTSVNVGTFHAYSHAQVPNLVYHYGRRLVQRMVKRQLHGRIAVSACARDFVAQYFEGEYVVIPNGIDLDALQRSGERDREFDDGRPTILFVGRLEKRKGLQYLLEAFPLVRERVPGARLIVAGEGRLRKLYQRQVEEQGGDVHFTGFVSDERKQRLFRTCDVVCAPSTGQESFGIILLEAMATGRPIVASDIDGYRDVLSHGREGLLVPPRNREALADALARLLLDRDLAEVMGRLGRWTARQYAWPKVANRVLEYYAEVLARVGPQPAMLARPLALEPLGG